MHGKDPVLSSPSGAPGSGHPQLPGTRSTAPVHRAFRETEEGSGQAERCRFRIGSPILSEKGEPEGRPVALQPGKKTDWFLHTKHIKTPSLLLGKAQVLDGFPLDQPWW